jgi:ABC-type multidrug transport system fused ATPase/permease subunit
VVRDLLNSMPDWALFAIVVGFVVVIALVALFLVLRYLAAWRVNAEVSAAVAAMVMTLFALVLAFASINLYDSYRNAKVNVAAEANSLAQIARDTRVFPKADQVRVDKEIVAYIREVSDTEFPKLRDGTFDPRSSPPNVERVFTAVESLSPKTDAQRIFLQSAVGKLNDMVAARRNRIDEANSSLPSSLVALIMLTGGVSILITLFLRMDARAMEILIVGSVAAVVGAGLLTILLLEYPFSGSVAVTPDVFENGVLGQLLKLYPG